MTSLNKVQKQRNVQVLTHANQVISMVRYILHDILFEGRLSGSVLPSAKMKKGYLKSYFISMESIEAIT